MSCADCSCSTTIANGSGNGVQVAVSAVEALALAANAHRKNATIQNLGSTTVYVYFVTGQFASAPYILLQGQGIALAQEGVGVYRGAVYVATASGNSVVGVVEET